MSNPWAFDKGSSEAIIRLDDLGIYKGYKIWLHVGKGYMVTIPNQPPQARPLPGYYSSEIEAREAIDTLPPPPPWIRGARRYGRG